MTATLSPKKQRLADMHTSFVERFHFCDKKYGKARSDASSDKWYSERKKYRELERRAFNLYLSVDKPSCLTSSYIKSIVSQGEWEGRLKRKAEGRHKFLNNHKYSRWFMSDSLGADYGQYTCNRCSSTFYHSPSSISLAGKQVFECVCGNCTNSIIAADWGADERPYK